MPVIGLGSWITFNVGEDPVLRELQQVSFAEFVRRDGLPEKVSEWIRVTLEPEMAIDIIWSHLRLVNAR